MRMHIPLLVRIFGKRSIGYDFANEKKYRLTLYCWRNKFYIWEIKEMSRLK